MSSGNIPVPAGHGRDVAQITLPAANPECEQRSRGCVQGRRLPRWLAAGVISVVRRLAPTTLWTDQDPCRGEQAGVDAWTHWFRHHFSRTWLDRAGTEGDLVELNGWSSLQMLCRYSASARSARGRRIYDRIVEARP